jgi:hypothetical protein
MSEAVTVAAIHAVEIIVPSGISAYVALMVVRVKKEVGEVKHAMNSILDKRVEVAHDLGAAEGNAAGIEQERNRGNGH